MTPSIAAGSVASRPVATPAGVRDCSYPPESFGPRNDRGMNLFDMSVRNMSCRRAHDTIARSKLLRSGSISARGFRCETLRRYEVRGTLLGAEVRCVSESRAFRFTWGT